jgi:hypothetical protein
LNNCICADKDIDNFGEQISGLGAIAIDYAVYNVGTDAAVAG